MDLLMLIAVAFFGVVPPGLVGYWAYKQGEKGRQMAVDARDLAVSKAEAIEAKLSTFKLPEIPPFPEIPKVEIPPFPEIPKLDLAPIEKKLDALLKADIKLSPDDIKEIATTLSLSLRGAAGAEKQKVTKELTEQYMASLTPEQAEELENAQFRKKFRDGILKFLPGSDD